MRELIVDAPRENGRTVILNDDLDTGCETAGGSHIQPDDRRFVQKTMRLRLPRGRAAPLRITAALLAATWASEGRATPGAPHAQVDKLASAQHASAARKVLFGGAGDHKLETVQASRFGDRSVWFAQGTIGETEDLKALKRERGQLKEATDNGATELCKSFNGDRADRLEQDLAEARRDVEIQTALAAKARDEVVRLKQEVESGAGELQDFLQQERARAGRLEQDLAVAQRGVETKTALAAKASYEAARFKHAAESVAGELQKSMQRERDVADRLEQDLVAARHDVETQTMLAAKASDEAARVKQAAERGTGELQKSMQQERDRADRLEQDLAAARRDVETQTALATKANDTAARSKQAADSGAGELQKSLRQERDRADRLEQDLAAARRYVETQTLVAVKASDEAARVRQAADSGAGKLQKSLRQERDRADRLEQDLAAAHRDVETQTALATKVSDEAARLKQAAESGVGELQKSLRQERDRADRLEQNLAVVRRNIEVQMALATKASVEAARVKQAADSAAGELQKSAQQERDKREQLERALASAAYAKDTPLARGGVTVGQIARDKPLDTQAKPIADQVAVVEARDDLQADAVEIARLFARARVLLGQGNIEAARILLEHAAERGSAQASFKLAETYDPLILPRWGTYGTRGDAAKARDLYAKAEAGGIKEAKERSYALRR